MPAPGTIPDAMESVHAARVPAGRRHLDVDRLGDHTDRLFRAALMFTGSRADAEDLVQETFLHILRRPRHVTGDSDLPYLLRALRNTWISSSRRQRRAGVVVGELHEEALEAVAAPAAMEGSEILDAVLGLPEHQRQVVVAVDVVGLSYREAARALGTRQGTIMSRLFRARRALADIIDRPPA
jgi:RNA polymerase sigma-70 factor (ECF subfamily)